MWTRSPRSSTERRLPALLLAAGLCLGPAAARGQDPAPAEIQEKARAVLGDGYQQALPRRADGEGGGEGLGGGYRPSGLGSPPGDGASRPRPAAAGGSLSRLMEITLGVLGVAALVLLAFRLFRDFPSRGVRSRTRSGEASPDGPDRPAPEHGPSLAEAERLAAQERWTEAVHLLLLVAIRHLSVRFSVPQAASRTSRELSRLLPLQKETREAFAGLVRTVEVSLFGGIPVGPADYRTSLESVRLLLRGAS